MPTSLGGVLPVLPVLPVLSIKPMVSITPGRTP